MGGITVINRGSVGAQITVPAGATITINGGQIEVDGGEPESSRPHWADGKRFGLPHGSTIDDLLTIREQIERLLRIVGPCSLQELQLMMRNVSSEDVDMALHDMLDGGDVVSAG